MTQLASCHLVAAPGNGVGGMLAWCVLGDTVVGMHVTGVPKEMAVILAASLPWEGRLSGCGRPPDAQEVGMYAQCHRH